VASGNGTAGLGKRDKGQRKGQMPRDSDCSLSGFTFLKNISQLKKFVSQAQWLLSIIPATQEVKIKRTEF
jgi:hypothetical protein